MKYVIIFFIVVFSLMLAGGEAERTDSTRIAWEKIAKQNSLELNDWVNDWVEQVKLRNERFDFEIVTEAERPDTTVSVGFNNRVVYRVFTREDMVDIKPDSLINLDSLVQSWLEEFK